MLRGTAMHIRSTAPVRGSQCGPLLMCHPASAMVAASSGSHRTAASAPRTLLPGPKHFAHRGAAGHQRIVKTRVATVTVPPGTMAELPDTTLWSVVITSSTPLLGDSGTKIKLRLVDSETDRRTGEFSVDDSEYWDQPGEATGTDGVAGWYRRGVVRVPADFKQPCAILVTKGRTINNQDSVDYITKIDISTPDGLISFPVHSWVSSVHGERVFFDGLAYLPKNTPKQLLDDRQRELTILRGEGSETEGTLRVYDYEVYNDLGNEKTPHSRPPLGYFGSNTDYPYPRRIKTEGRGKEYIPYDEQFNYSKQRGFKGDTLAGLAVAAGRGLESLAPPLPNWMPEIVKMALGFLPAGLLLGVFKRKIDFRSFAEVMDLYKDDNGLNWRGSVRAEAAAEDARLKEGPLRASAIGKSYEQQQAEKRGVPAPLEPASIQAAEDLPSKIGRGIQTLFKDNEGEQLDDLLKYPVPKVEDHREGQWKSDIEFGRQMLAGMDPVELVAITQLPAGCNIKAEHVDDDLERLANTSLDKLLKQAADGGKPQLFLIDFWYLNSMWKVSKVQTDREEHVGRCLLFLDQTGSGADRGLIPLAIELMPRSRDTEGQATGGTVYSRYQLTQANSKEANLWQLAKFVFRSIESGHHQLISHWLRCHACTEPFLIAMRRNMSIMHPISKLMLPHFRYTININTNARTSLINEGGTIEKAFSPGDFAMRLSAVAYGAKWRFRLQSLPDDLKHRGLLDKQGKSWFTDYPYADDGMDIWNAYTEYFKDYLQLYYKDSKDIAADTELQGWWSEVKTVGHGDVLKKVEDDLRKQGVAEGLVTPQAEKEVWGFDGPISDISQLVKVLTTIAWTASVHHAAVNFGQYDFSALLLNSSSMIRRPIPRPASVQGRSIDEGYEKLVNAKGLETERELLTYLNDLVSTLTVMTTVKLLSGHADDEQYLDEPNDNFTDPDAVQLNREFINKMKALEVKFLNRNADPSRWTRVRDQKAALQYTLMYPSSNAGVTMRGVPYSVSI